MATIKANHQANIVRITDIQPHTNADNLEVIHLGGYQVVVRKGEFKPGDLGVYIQPDSVVPQTEPFRFIWGPYATAETAPPSASDPLGLGAEVPEKRRRITVRKFRGEWSEGLLLPSSDFQKEFTAHNGLIDVVTPNFTEGTDVSDILGITHYDPDAGKESTTGGNMHAPRKKGGYPKTLRGWLFFLASKIGLRFKGRNRLHGYNDSRGESLGIPSYDVDALKNYKNVFVPGEEVIVTEKIHGSNARYTFYDDVMYAGSKNFWKAPDSHDIWRNALKANPAIEAFCRTHPGYVLYGEVTPTQGEKYNYGTNDPQFFLFDIRTPDGQWLDYDDAFALLAADPNGPFIRTVPLIYSGPYKADLIKDLAEGISQVPNYNNIREGVVVKAAKERTHYGPSMSRAMLKVVSNRFLEKDK